MDLERLLSPLRPLFQRLDQQFLSQQKLNIERKSKISMIELRELMMTSM